MALSAQNKKLIIKTLEEEFTEERSDVVKRAIKKKVKARLPRKLRWLPIGRVIDALLPEVFIDVVKDVL